MRTIILTLMILVFFSCSTQKKSINVLAPNASVDMDGDGINDDNDKCPTIPGLAKYNGCPVPDTDADGINDEIDKCPNIKGLARYKGCPIPDTDGDGINDEEDKCPTASGLVNNSGCPAISETNAGGFPSKQDEKVIPSNGINPPKQKVTKSDTFHKKANQHKVGKDNNSSYENKDIKTASLAVSYYPKMKAGEKKDLIVMVDISHPEAALRTILRKEEFERNKWVQKTDTSAILTDHIEVYKKLSVFLIPDDTTELKIENFNVVQDQNIDMVKGNKWHWKIKVLALKEVSKLTIKFVAETPDGSIVKLSDKVIEIKIAIGWWDIFLNWLYFLLEHPEITITSIVIPLVIFFYKKIKNQHAEKP